MFFKVFRSQPSDTIKAVSNQPQPSSMADATKIPLIGAASKPKKQEKSYWFELTLKESNDETYPEFSWTELVADRKAQSAKKKLTAGKTLLDPHASDDDDDLKAMAARFEQKYGNGTVTTPPKKITKRKRIAEDYIDRGAGYDESDSFIDNSDVYDEVVPADLETVRGGFYINSGSLDFREVEISDDDEPQAEGSPAKNGKLNNSSSKESKPIKRPSLVVSKKHPVAPGKPKSSSKDVDGKPKLSVKPNPAVAKPDAASAGSNKKSPSEKSDSSSSGSSSSSSSSSGDSSTSSDSSSSGEEDNEEHVKKNVLKKPSIMAPQIPSTDSDAGPPIKRLKTKNVPPKPDLAKPKLINTNNSPSPLITTTKELIVTSSTPNSKLAPRPNQSISPITAVSSLGIPLPHGITASNIKVPTPKTTPTGATSSSALNLVRSSSNKISKPKQQRQNVKQKMNLSLPAAIQLAQAADFANNLALVQSFAASAQAHPKMKAKAKAKHLLQQASSGKSSSSSSPKPLLHQPQQPPKLKAKQKMSTSLPPPSLQPAVSLSSQSLPGFRIAQPPPLTASTVEITKIKPAHSNSSPSSSSSHLNSSIKQLSNLGSGITVTEVKDKMSNNASSSGNISHHSSSSGMTTSHITMTSSGGGGNQRSRSPNVLNSNMSGSHGSRPSLTITPSPLLNLSTSGSHTGASSTAANITLANLNMMPPVSSSRSSPYGHQSAGSAGSKKSITPFNVNNILSSNDFSGSPTSSSNKNDFYHPNNLANAVAAMAYNSYFNNSQKK